MKGRMTRSRKIAYLLPVVIILFLAGFFLFRKGRSLSDGTVIASMVPVNTDLFGDSMGNDGRYPEGSKVVAFPPDASQKPIVLTDDFHSARSPEISFTGQMMVFSGQRDEGAMWQIFVMDLQSLKATRVTDSPVNCTDPAWLPDGRILFSRLNDEPPVGQLHVLYSCEVDGSALERLTFQPNTSVSTTVLTDGRLVMQDRQVYPEYGPAQIIALRPDGTKSELFYLANDNGFTSGKIRETLDGQVYFIEFEDAESRNGRVMAVSGGRPLGTRTEISSGVNGKFYSLFPLSEEVLLVSYKPEESLAYGLYTLNVGDGKMGTAIRLDDRYHIVEPVLIERRRLPRKLPITVDESKEKGTLLCHDADLSVLSMDNEAEGKATKRVQVFGLEGLVGELPVADDGSFYIEVEADTPVRFRTVDADGAVLRGPSAWISVRPGERRSCIGCHEDRELAPENKVPSAIYDGLVSLPEGTRSAPIMFTESSR